MKELFLVQRETVAGRAGLLRFDFSGGPYGPSSFDVSDAVDDLTRREWIRQESAPKSDAVIVRLGRKGFPRASELWGQFPTEVRESIYSVKSRCRDWTYKTLLVYVYRTYPEFTTNSVIRDEVLE
ncbi:MAG TPA: hypothetical protein VFF67_10430 [Thermoplasmata archaeon]|nr:hypothetical protein [Thermoplasmata archaeon]